MSPRSTALANVVQVPTAIPAFREVATHVRAAQDVPQENLLLPEATLLRNVLAVQQGSTCQATRAIIAPQAPFALLPVASVPLFAFHVQPALILLLGQLVALHVLPVNTLLLTQQAAPPAARVTTAPAEAVLDVLPVHRAHTKAALAALLAAAAHRVHINPTLQGLLALLVSLGVTRLALRTRALLAPQVGFSPSQAKRLVVVATPGIMLQALETRLAPKCPVATTKAAQGLEDTPSAPLVLPAPLVLWVQVSVQVVNLRLLALLLAKLVLQVHSV
jgi:hypothetical protein